MLNFYPWGLSLNLVMPEAIDRTRVAFRSFVWDADDARRGAGRALDRVEMEDEAIVQAVQRGVRSRLYRGGRYSPTRERGVHHFHRLLCEFMASRAQHARNDECFGRDCYKEILKQVKRSAAKILQRIGNVLPTADILRIIAVRLYGRRQSAMQ